MAEINIISVKWFSIPVIFSFVAEDSDVIPPRSRGRDWLKFRQVFIEAHEMFNGSLYFIGCITISSNTQASCRPIALTKTAFDT